MKISVKNNIKAVFFDLDDTLFDRDQAQSRILELIVRRFPQLFHGLKVESIKAAFAESDRLTVADFEAGAPSSGLREMRSKFFLRLLGIRKDYADAITEVYIREYPEMNTPVAGAVHLVKELSLKYMVGVVSNGLPDVQYRKLETIGLRNVFSCIVLSEEIGIRKPDPRIFHHAADLLKVRPQVCLYVGDSYDSDVVGAETAGMMSCWLSPKPSITSDVVVRAGFVISHLQELGEML